jgi:Family of unknown function (DUF5522)
MPYRAVHINGVEYHLAMELWQLRPDHRRPLAKRLSPLHPRHDEIMHRHDSAVVAGDPNYFDPTSGFSVFTAEFLANRGYCCLSSCRHCPYEQRGD